MTSIPPDLFGPLVQFIMPFMADPDEREAWLTQAFYLRDSQLFYGIDRRGKAMPFATQCMKTLSEYGCVSEPRRQHMASILLETLRMGCGPDKHRQIDGFITALDQVCKETPPAPPPTPPTSVPPPVTPLQTVETRSADRTPVVFVSYSRHDEAIAKRLIADLNQAGHACWFDQTSIKSDDVWSKAISAGINRAYAFVTLVSAAANASKWVLREYLAADEKSNLPMLVMQLEACEIPIQMKDKQATRLFPDYADGLRRLLAALPAPPTAVSVPNVVSQRQLELDYLSGLKLEEWLKTIQTIEQYTTLRGTAQVSEAAQASGAASAHHATALMTQKYRHLQHFITTETAEPEHAPARHQQDYSDILQAIREVQRAVLLGEPGAGKTTTLWRLAKDMVAQALSDPRAPIPVLVRLGKWTQADESLTAFIQREMGELGLYLDQLIAEQRVALLLDGLNEIPVAQRSDPQAGKDQQVQSLIRRAYAANPHLIGVISCRERDYTLDLGFDHIDIAPLDAARIHEFVVRYLGDADGEKMFWKLAGGEAVKQVWHKWQTLGASWELFFTTTSISQDLLDVYYKTSWEEQNLWRQHIRAEGTLLKLAQNPYMLFMMTDIYRAERALPDNRGELFSKFVDALIAREQRSNARMTAREADLLCGLAKLAYAMQQRREVGDDVEDVQDTVATTLGLAEVQHSLLDEELLYLAGSASLLTVGDTVRFSHQLLQEYFAALYMLQEIQAGRLKASDLWPPERWWQPTGWEEAAILLVGMFPDQIDWVTSANPELASQCMARSGAKLTSAHFTPYQASWLQRLTDVNLEPEPKARAALGRALAITNLDNRPGVGLRPDGLPDILWCEIPAGEFLYQQGDKLSLPTFYIAKYPLTYQQFQAFLDSGDYADARWWQGFPEYYQPQPMAEQRFKYANHPRDNVSWYQAVAFTRWLSARYESLTPNPSPTRGEGNKSDEGAGEHWEISAELGRRMGEIAAMLRQAQTPSEGVLWQAVRNRQIAGYKFRRHEPIGPFVVDFYCPEARLIVEVDGPIHQTQQEADAARQALLESLGLHVLRVTDVEVMTALPTVLQRIHGAVYQPRCFTTDQVLSLLSSSSTAHPSHPSFLPSPLVGEGLGVRATLPTEQQWEKAACGPYGLAYAYGDTFDAAKCNADQTGIGQTSAVGIFPNGASPYGVLDMSGNVWEWCLNEYKSGTIEINNNVNIRVLRGGSWINDSVVGFRCDSRFRNDPDGRNGSRGVRLALS